MQVINAFVSGGYVAYVKKNNVLKYNSEQYNTAVKFIKEVNSIDLLLDLFMLYRKAEEVKMKKKIAGRQYHTILLIALQNMNVRKENHNWY